MSEYRRRRRRSKTNRWPAALLSPVIVLGGVIAILVATLQPFEFHFHRLTISEYITGYVLPPNSFMDFPRNILLFIPFGFGLAAILDQMRWSGRRRFIAVASCGFLLTLTIESLQLFLNGRQPSVADLVANTLGALVGLACFHIWSDRRSIIEQISYRLKVSPNAVVALAIFLLLLISITYLFSSRIRSF